MSGLFDTGLINLTSVRHTWLHQQRMYEKSPGLSLAQLISPSDSDWLMQMTCWSTECSDNRLYEQCDNMKMTCRNNNQSRLIMSWQLWQDSSWLQELLHGSCQCQESVILVFWFHIVVSLCILFFSGLFGGQRALYVCSWSVFQGRSTCIFQKGHHNALLFTGCNHSFIATYHAFLGRESCVWLCYHLCY